MKETKVYVDDELLINDDLSLCCTKDFDNKFYTNNYSLIDNEEYFAASFEDIKTHDRELVKEVCEKIRSELEKELKYDFTSYVPIMNVCNKINRVLDQTQKEYEK